ncbi:hypothetical protein V5799_025959 [Amblyomma americanum]|uniref:SLC26A/SulP transporter domain-containing protein n=1 Tax=Amblyomma americanum TaxID=6943 RepID=A0AAQ4DJZ1_AMBAM
MTARSPAGYPAVRARHGFTQDYFDTEFAQQRPTTKGPLVARIRHALGRKWKRRGAKPRFLGCFPIVSWLREYDPRHDLLPDLLTGITLAVFHVPQIVHALVHAQLLFGLLRLGSLSVFLSEQLVSGFTAGVSVHIGSSQLPGLFGIDVTVYSGPFHLIKGYIEFFHRIAETHLPTLALSVTSFVIMLLIKIFVDPLLLKKVGIPFPIEMVVVVSFVNSVIIFIVITCLSSYFEKLPVARNVIRIREPSCSFSANAAVPAFETRPTEPVYMTGEPIAGVGRPSYIIFDFSRVSFVDGTSINTMMEDNICMATSSGLGRWKRNHPPHSASPPTPQV